LIDEILHISSCISVFGKYVGIRYGKIGQLDYVCKVVAVDVPQKIIGIGQL
jgi:starvation-inducible outer membrane lipoprotein